MERSQLPDGALTAPSWSARPRLEASPSLSLSLSLWGLADCGRAFHSNHVFTQVGGCSDYFVLAPSGARPVMAGGLAGGPRLARVEGPGEPQRGVLRRRLQLAGAVGDANAAAVGRGAAGPVRARVAVNLVGVGVLTRLAAVAGAWKLRPEDDQAVAGATHRRALPRRAHLLHESLGRPLRPPRGCGMQRPQVPGLLARTSSSVSCLRCFRAFRRLGAAKGGCGPPAAPMAPATPRPPRPSASFGPCPGW